MSADTVEAQTLEQGGFNPIFVILIFAVVGLALANRYLAGRRGRDQSTWYWFGVLFPVVSLVVLALLPAVSDEKDDAAETVAARRFGRRQILGVFFGLTGVVLVLLLAPNLTTETRAFAFEPPKLGEGQLAISFSPRALVLVIGIIYWAVAGLSFLPHRHDRKSLIAQIVAAALAVPLTIGVALALSASATWTNVMVLFDVSLMLATPIVLGAMTGLWSERSGIINIGIEGMMLGAAGVGFMAFSVLGAASSTAWLWFAILVAILTGGLLALLHAVLSIRFQVNQIVSGVVINILALGLTGFIRSQVIVPSGHSKGISTADLGLPLLKDIPIVGDTLFTGRPLHFLMYLVVFLTWLVMFRTAWGLRVRACGEQPHAAETLGINVIKIRYQAVVLGGFIAGIAGAWFSMEAQSGFEDSMTAGAGFIALAAMIFGKWTPWGAFGGGMLFGFARALGSRLQFLNVEIGEFAIPSEFFQMLPFVVTLVVVAGALGRAVAPASEGLPYAPSK